MRKEEGITHTQHRLKKTRLQLSHCRGEDVEEFMSKKSGGAEEVIRRLDEQLSNYRCMESYLTATRLKLKHQMPDIKSCLQIIEEMKARQDSTEDMET